MPYLIFLPKKCILNWSNTLEVTKSKLYQGKACENILDHTPQSLADHLYIALQKVDLSPSFIPWEVKDE